MRAAYGLLDVARPGLDRARDRTLGRLVAGEVLAPHREQLVAGALQQPPVELELGGEVVVDDRRRDAGAPRDLVDRRAAVAALGEHLRRARARSARGARGGAAAACVAR